MQPALSSQLREWLPPFRLPEKLLAAAAVVWIGTWFSASPFVQTVAWAITTLLALVVAIRLGRFFLSRLIWRLRNRLLVAFLFVGVLPIALVLAFAFIGSQLAAGQLAVYFAHSKLDERLEALQSTADAIARAESGGYSKLRAEIEASFPGAQTSIEPGQTSGGGHGLAISGGVLHAWARSVRGNARATILTPLNRDFFAALDPDLGRISLVPPSDGDFQFGPDTQAIENAGVGTIPPPANWLDSREILGFNQIPILNWSAPNESRVGVLGVRTRYSALIGRLATPGVEIGNSFIILYGLGALVLIAELISLFIGFSVSRTMTAAVHNLYEGTTRVMQGDFAHRIPVRGNEQIADLSRSFNTMTENVERLLIVSKESERMQAELEIARRVQQQLFPAQTPHSASLEIRAVCQPARQVSGDYYDYQALPDNKLVLALGDVAGKGISAALLMASLQSTLRVQLREWKTDVSTQRLVTGLNHHLFLNTTPEKYATFFLAIYDEATGMLEYTNAGHLAPLLVRAGTITRLDSNGMVVGAFATATYDSSHLQLESGDLLVCYTDGVTELENEFEEQFGEGRLSEVLLRCKTASLCDVETAILDAATKFSGSPEPQDDLTMLMVRRT
jgi:phosphoserine phosphatase RsbU/P